MSFVGYIKNTENQTDYRSLHQAIIAFAKENGFDLTCFYVETDFEKVKTVLPSDCQGIIVGNIASLGTTLTGIRDGLYFCKQNGLCLYSVFENYCFTKDKLTDELLRGMDLAIDVRYQMTSVVTKKALAKKKETGFKLGRKGKFNRKYVLSGKENEVYRLLDSGMPKVQIAKELNISPASLYNFLNRQHSKSYVKEVRHAV